MANGKPYDRILDTATRLFYREGIRAIGVNRIIAEADVAPMTLYRQFGGKDELLTTALERWSGTWLHTLRARLDQFGDDPQTRFSALWDALEEWFATPDFRGSFVENVAAELHNQPDHPAQRVIIAHRMSMRRLLEELARDAGAPDPAALAMQLLVLVQGAVATAVGERRRPIVAAVRALAMAALPHGSIPESAPAA